MITKRIRRNNIVSEIAKAVIYGVLTEILFLAVILFTESWSRLLQSLAVAGVLTVVYIIIASFRAMGRNHAFMKKLKHQNSDVSLDDDSYTAVSRHVSLGNSWLVYHQGNRVEPIARGNVCKVVTDGQNAVLYNADHQPVLTFRYRGKEDGIPDRIRQWINVNKNSEYK